MKRKTFLSMATILSVVMFLSCEKDSDVKEPIYRLIESSYNGESPTYYEYDNEGKIIKSYAYTEDSMEVSRHYTYNNTKELLSINDFQGTVQNYEVNFTRSGNVVSHTSKRADMDGNLIDEEGRIDLYLNSNQQVERYVYIYRNETNVWDTSRVIEYTWTAGNRVKSESFSKNTNKKSQQLHVMIDELYSIKKAPMMKNVQLTSSSITTSDFDTKHNYNNGFGTAHQSGILSDNNRTKYKSIDSETEEIRYEGEYSYEYNSMDYPVKYVDNYNWFGDDMTDTYTYKYDYIN